MAKKKKINEDEADDDSNWVGCPNPNCSGGTVTDEDGNNSNCKSCGGWGQVPVD